MSIADIFKIQTAYNTNGTFKDQTNWQDAFNIANAFNQSASLGAKAREDWRKYYFNEAVQETGIDAQNALNRNTVNKADWETAFRNATEQNRINYTNWDYGNKQQVGNLKVADLQRLFSNAKQADLIAAEERVRQAELNKLLQEKGINSDGSIVTPQQILQQYGKELSPASFAQLYNSLYGNKELTWQQRQDYENDIWGEQQAKRLVSEYVMNGGDINSKEGMEHIASLAQLLPKQSHYFQQIYKAPALTPQGQGQGQSPQQTTPIKHKVVVEDYTPPTSSVPVDVNTPEPQADPALDFRKNYGVTDNEMALVNRYMQATGMNEQEALKNLRAYFEMRRSNVHSPEKATQLMLEEVIKAERQKRVKEQIGNYVHLNQELNRLIGNK